MLLKLGIFFGVVPTTLVNSKLKMLFITLLFTLLLQVSIFFTKPSPKKTTTSKKPLKLFQQIESSGKIAIRLQEYANPTGLIANGNCCDGQTVILPSTTPICSSQCNTQVLLCIDDYASNAAMDVCPYGRRQLSAINNQNNVTFQTPTVADVENPVLFTFYGTFQPKGYRLKITVTDQKTNLPRTIDTIKIDFQIPVPYQLNPGLAGPQYLPFQVAGERTAAPKTTYVLILKVNIIFFSSLYSLYIKNPIRNYSIL